MKIYRKIIPILLIRDLCPAGDGEGFRQLVTYRFFVSLLPPVGIFLVLLIVSFAGLCLEAARQGVDGRLAELKTSPYMALFGEGFLYDNQKTQERHHGSVDLAWWRKLKIGEVPCLTKAPEYLKSAKLFSGGVFPFSWVYLQIRNKDNEHLPYLGMGLAFSGEDKDEALIGEIEKNLEKNSYLPDKRGEGIIISRKGLKDLRWGKANRPPFLWVRFFEDDEVIPLRSGDVAERLPHQFKYIVSMKQLNLMKSMYYYHSKKNFQIGFLDGYTERKKAEVMKKLPPESEINGPIRKGEIDAIQIILPEPWPRVRIIKEFWVPNYDKRKLWMGSNDCRFEGKGYDGAIFHINSHLLEPNLYEDGLLLKIQEFMEEKGIKVKSGLVHALQLIIHDQKSLGKLRNLSKWGLLAIALILMVFFSVMIHTRMHRIGVIRMFGVPDMVLLIVYFWEGVILVFSSFFISATVFHLVRPLGLELCMWNLNIMKLIGLIILFTELGVLIPLTYFLKMLKSAEMVMYRV